MSQSEIEQVRAAIAALEAQRGVLGDEVVETALAPLREKLDTLTKPAETPDERKRITVLFADVSGYTAMSEHLDPEDVTVIMNRLFDQLTDAITRYGGTIDKYSGDAVMALFGAPEALENHEEMGVRAALAMQQAVREFSAGLEAERGLSLRLRIGLHTGEVLAGWVGGGDVKSYTVMGDTVNLAARLEHACPVGRVMISDETARPLHAVFEFEPAQNITVKGKSEPITVCVVAGAKTERGRGRGVAGLTAPMVGRDAELATLRDSFEQALDERPWQAVAVVGEAGIGKSRLAREFVNWVAEVHPKTRLLRARSYAHTQATPYYLAAGLLRALFELREEIEAGGIDARLSEALQTLQPDIDETELRYQLGSLASVLGVTLDDDPLDGLDPEQRRDRTFLSLERILLTASSRTPLLIVVDDLHWADAISLDFFERLLQTAAREPAEHLSAMLLLLSRPPEDDYTPFVKIMDQIREAPHVTLDLRRLDNDVTGALVTALLDQELPADLTTLVVEHAQGNPFFVEEILRSLIEEGTLVRNESGWRVTQPIADVRVPGTVQDVLAARLDRLPAEDKRVSQYAAIIGRTFWQRLLTDVLEDELEAGNDTAAMVEAALERLEARHFVGRLHQSQLADDWEWFFEHVLIQDVAYAGVLKSVRRRVHRAVAQRLEAHLTEQAGFLIPLIAFHYERGDEPAKAVEYLHKAGDRAAEQYANEDAVDYYTRALDLLEDAGLPDDKTPVLRYELLLGREGVYGLMGRREEQFRDLEQLKRISEKTNDSIRRAEVALRYTGFYEVTSEFTEARAYAQEVVHWAEQIGNLQRKIEGIIAWGRSLWRQGKYREASYQLQQALHLARNQGDTEGEASSLHYLGTVQYILGNHQKARDYLERALSLRQMLGDRRGEALSLNNLVAVYDGLGDYARGKAVSNQALYIYQSIGDRRGEGQALANLGNIHHALGELTTARKYHEKAYHLFTAIGDRRGQSLSGNNLGLVLHDLGNYRQAQQYCERALSIARDIGDRRTEGYSLTYLAMALEGLNKLEAATETYQKGLTLRQEIGQNACAVDNLAGLASTALKRNKMTEALTFVNKALDWMNAHGIDGIESPIRIYLIAADTFDAADRPQRAASILTIAHDLLLERADRISDQATQIAFLEQVPHHRQLRKRVKQL